MPELAEVAYYARQWDWGLGQPVLEVEVHARARVFRDLVRPGRLFRALEGTCLAERRTHGKQMFFRFGGRWLSGHLGMTGKLWVAGEDHLPGKHDHLVLRQAKRQLVFTDPRMFGHWQILREAAMHELWANLPPEITDRGFTKARLGAFLKRRGRRPIKAVLLMQEMFPGIGNWMADEVLWRSSMNPRRLAGSLRDAEVATLWRSLRFVCRQALRIIGTSWNPLPDAWLFNHRWADGGRCPCGAALVRESIGGRKTCWCPVCQGG